MNHFHPGYRPIHDMDHRQIHDVTRLWPQLWRDLFAEWMMAEYTDALEHLSDLRCAAEDTVNAASRGRDIGDSVAVVAEKDPDSHRGC